MKNVTFLGVEGSGKTVLTSSLVNVFKAHEREGWYLRPDSREAFRFLEQAPAALEGDALPHQTTALKRLAWSVQLDKETVRTFDVLDYPGEIYRLVFLDAKDDADPASFEVRIASNKEDIDAVLSHLMESDQVFVLFNLADAQDLSKNSANLDAVWVTNACLDYLHRLPHHPTITLLLTQIDRYVDMQKCELDPGVYVAQRLPLIHRNFPDLDVLAVSAVGPADATYGIDSIILRCLFECELVQSNVRTLRQASSAVHDWFNNFRLSDVTDMKLANIHNQLDMCQKMATKIPWFIPLSQLQDNGFVVDSDEISDERTLLELLKVVDMFLERPEVRRKPLVWVEDKMSDYVASSKKGSQYREAILELVRTAIVDCDKQEEQNRITRKQCNVAIVVLAGVAVIELLIMFGRMVF